MNHPRLSSASARTELLYQVTDFLNHYIFSLLSGAILTGPYQSVDLFRMRSTTNFSQYPKSSCSSKIGFHYLRLYYKAYNLTFNGMSKILWTVTLTEISFPVVPSTYNKLFSKQSYLFITYNIIHCVKSVQIRSFFWSVFSRIQTEYGEMRSK